MEYVETLPAVASANRVQAPRQYIAWGGEFSDGLDPEEPRYAVITLATIAKEMMQRHYSGDCMYTEFACITTGDMGLPILRGVEPTWQSSGTDDDDYIHVNYRLEDAEGFVYDEFTVRIDGRA